MGSEQASLKNRFEAVNQNELLFYTEVEDPMMGPVKIYTSRKFNLCYILKCEHQNQDSKIYNTFRAVEMGQFNPLLSLYGFNVERQTCCGQIIAEKITSYWQYYNFYFHDYLDRRAQQRITFIDSEIWHIVDVCSETYKIFRKFGIFYQISPQTFVITPEGKLKAFWAHLRSQNNHIKFFQFFSENLRVSKFAYAPEQMRCMHEQERTNKIDFDKSNSFRLGILLLRCLSLVDPLSHCYNPSMTSINFSNLKGLIATHLAPHYSGQLVSLVKSLLREDPSQRPTLTDVYEENISRFSPEFELRVCGIKVDNSVDSQAEIEGTQHMGAQQLGKNKNFDLSDAKTVKLRHSIRKY